MKRSERSAKKVLKYNKHMFNFHFTYFHKTFLEAGLFKKKVPYENLKIEIKNIDYVSIAIRILLVILGIALLVPAFLVLFTYGNFSGFREALMLYVPVLLFGAVISLFSKNILSKDDSFSLVYEINGKTKKVGMGMTRDPEKTKAFINMFRKELFNRGFRAPEIILKGQPRTYKR